MSRAGEIIVRSVMRLYPRAFRDRFGEEMVSAYLDQRDARRGTTLATVAGILRALPAAHVAERARERSARLHHPPIRNRHMKSFSYDLRHVVRSLRKQPAFAIVAVLTLALGIGANTAVFSVLNSVVLAPLPYSEPDRLVRIYASSLRQPTERGYHTGPDIVDVRDNVPSFASVGVMYTYRETGNDLMVDGVAQRIRIVPVGADYFTALGATPELGRTFTRDEERFGIRRVILSHALWMSLTNGNRNVLGTMITLSGDPFEVVGVMRAGFRDASGNNVAAWTPQDLQPGPRNHPGNSYLSAIARLAPGITLAQAQADVDRVMTRRRAEVADSNQNRTAVVIPLHDDVVGDSPAAVYVLMGAAGLVLLIACLNVASLFLARAVAQTRETAIRTALGAARSRLVSQRLTESLLVAVAGGIVGSLVAYAGVKALLIISPDSIARAEDVGFDRTLFAFALGTTILTGILFGMFPAMRASRADPIDALHDSARGNSEGKAGRRARNALVACQIAAALILLVGSGTLIRSFLALQNVDLGFDGANVATFDVNLPDTRYADPVRRAQFHREFRTALAAVPGVTEVGATSWLPANGMFHQWGFGFIDSTGERRNIAAQVRIIDGDFFKALRIKFVSGESFGPESMQDSIGTAVINSALAKKAFGSRPAIGEVFRTTGRLFRVAGIVSDVAFEAVGTRTEHIYLSHEQFANNRNWALTYVVRANGDDAQVIAAARQAMAKIDPELVLYHPRTMDDVLGSHRARQEFTFLLMTIFAGVALSLAAVGVYGVLSYAVTQRRHEIGVRMALGAQAAQVRGIVVAHAAKVAGIGMIVGLAGALALAQLLRGLVFGVPSRDPVVFVVVTLVLGAVVVVAGYVPARRAVRTNPLESLRAD